MSRIGKMPVVKPAGVEVTVSGSKVSVKGPKGSLSLNLPDSLKVDIADNQILCSPKYEAEGVKALWGLYRVLIANMVEGVLQGYKKSLEVVGVGYKLESKGKDLVVAAGLSHPVTYKALDGIKFTLEGATKVHIEGVDKQLVGQVAAEIRSIRPPEPYKGKGIRYIGERVRQKAGKSAVK